MSLPANKLEPAIEGRNGEVADGGDERRSAVVDWHLLLALFVTFRLFTLFFVKPAFHIYVGPLDYGVYRRFGELSLDGYWPFLDYWVEYPPIFPWVVVGIYHLTFFLPPPPTDTLWFERLLGLFLVVFETGNLVLIYHLSKDIWGTAGAQRSALIYAGLFGPLFVLLNWYDSFPLFFLLLTILLAARRRFWLAGIATGVGFMVKLFPALAVPAVLRYVGWKSRVAFGLAAMLSVITLALPFVLHDPKWLLASLRATLTRASWETIWALADGYYGYGLVAPLAQRFDPASATWTSHPSEIPWALVNLVFVVACVLVFVKRPPLPSPRAIAAAAGLTLSLFLIFSKGYSPQYLIYPLAMIAVLLPTGWGVAYAVLLTLCNFVDWPVFFVHFENERWLLAISIIVRTVVLIALSVEFATLLFERSRPRWVWLRQQAALTVLFTLIGGLAVVAGTLVQHNTRIEKQPLVVSYLKSVSGPGHGLVAPNRPVFYSLKPYFRDEAFFLAEEDGDLDSVALERRLRAFSTGKARIWLLFRSSTQGPMRNALIGWYDGWGSRTTDAILGDWQVLGYERAP